MKTSLFHSVSGKINSTRWITGTEVRGYFVLLVWTLGLKAKWAEFEMLYKRILSLRKASGKGFLIDYLKEVVKILVLYISGTPYSPNPNGVRIKLARSGLPLFIPRGLRSSFTSLKRGTNTAMDWVCIRGVLSALTVFRAMHRRPILKLNTITDGFSGTAPTLPFEEVSHVLTLMRITLPRLKASPWLISESAGPNYPKATWGAPLDALAMLANPSIWYAWLVLAFLSRSWILLFWQLGFLLLSLPFVPALLVMGIFPTKLGKLEKLFEAAGKVRVVAITDWWTQALLRPLHDGIYDTVLRTIREDGTFNQIRPIDLLLRDSRGRKVYSFDLSAATDRLPVALQIQILSILIGKTYAKMWARLLTDRVWFLKKLPVKYSVGQPMGAYSSWAMLAFTHHVIVQVAAYRVGWRVWFPHYGLLGDDIVIADTSVAEAYSSLMAYLGVPINMSKSLVSEKGCLEFAKRWVHPDLGEFTPLGANVLLATVRNLRYIPMLVAELSNKRYPFYPSGLIDITSAIKKLRKSKTSQGLLKVGVSLLALGPAGGYWRTSQLEYFYSAWISTFNSRASVPVTVRLVYQALKDLADDRVSRAWDNRVLAQKDFVSNWAKFPVLGTGLARAVLSVPLMLLAPGVWAHARSFWKDDFDFMDLIGEMGHSDSTSEELPSPKEFARLSRATIGDLTSLRWAERAVALDFFAAQDYLYKRVEHLRGIEVTKRRSRSVPYHVARERALVQVKSLSDKEEISSESLA